MQLGHEIFKVKDGKMKLDYNKKVARKLWDNYYIPYIKVYFTASGGNFGSDHRDSAYLSGGLYFDPRCSVFKTEPVFTDLQFR